MNYGYPLYEDDEAELEARAMRHQRWAEWLAQAEKKRSQVDGWWSKKEGKDAPKTDKAK